ncbi:Protein lethal(3)malignant blood neoplasm 1 [Gryllus bimaculatus]|nr:Protein lethal(3)malignant blood neoplasm 1 [Gryllus bimaculatus]
MSRNRKWSRRRHWRWQWRRFRRRKWSRNRTDGNGGGIGSRGGSGDAVGSGFGGGFGSGFGGGSGGSSVGGPDGEFRGGDDGERSGGESFGGGGNSGSGGAFRPPGGAGSGSAGGGGGGAGLGFRGSPGEERDGLPPGVSMADIMALLYKFNYTVGFHGHHERGYANGDKEGGYFVNGRDGISRRVEYVANEFGYQPNITLHDLGLDSPDTPHEDTERQRGLEGYEFTWYPPARAP